MVPDSLFDVNLMVNNIHFCHESFAVWSAEDTESSTVCKLGAADTFYHRPYLKVGFTEKRDGRLHETWQVRTAFWKRIVVRWARHCCLDRMEKALLAHSILYPEYRKTRYYVLCQTYLFTDADQAERAAIWVFKPYTSIVNSPEQENWQYKGRQLWRF